MTNTPGLYYAVAYWLMVVLHVAINRGRAPGVKAAAVLAGSLAVLVGYMSLTAWADGLLFIASMALVVSIIGITLHICCSFNWRTAGYYCAQAFIAGEFMASLAWQVVYYVSGGAPQGHAALQIFTCALVYGAVFGILYALLSPRAATARALVITGKTFALTAITAIAIYAFSNLSYVYTDTPFSGTGAGDVFNIRTIMDLCGVAMLMAMHENLLETQARQEMSALQNTLNAQYANYKMSSQSIELVNRKYHDLKHQIALLRAEARAGQDMPYLDELEHEIKVYEAGNKTGNPVLDTILTGKSIVCQNKGIELTSVADGTLLQFMSAMDLSTLLGNALDNAIESVEHLPRAEQRLIHLSISRQKQFVRIHLENYCEQPPQFEKGLPRTTKHDRQNHGFGTKSIVSIVERYHGSAVMEMKNNWFELRILIPIA